VGVPLTGLALGVEQLDQQQGAQDGQGRQGQQPLEHVQPVAAQRQGPSGLELAGEGEGEEERRDEQEDVHPAGDPAEEHVVGHDQQHGQRPQPLHLGAEPGVPVRGAAGARAPVARGPDRRSGDGCADGRHGRVPPGAPDVAGPQHPTRAT
jgi:hypothetical protein